MLLSCRRDLLNCFIHSFSTLFEAVPGTLQGAGDTVVNMQHKAGSQGISSFEGKAENESRVLEPDFLGLSLALSN